MGLFKFFPSRSTHWMKYPLGSFPRFAHQQRWADERRQRAISNSIATRRAMAERHLCLEMEFYEEMRIHAQTMQAQKVVKEERIAEAERMLESIRLKHAAGKRVYYRALIDALLFFCEIMGICPDLKHKSHDELVSLVQTMALNRLDDDNSLG
jgi:hypothetical protein